MNDQPRAGCPLHLKQTFPHRAFIHSRDLDILSGQHPPAMHFRPLLFATLAIVPAIAHPSIEHDSMALDPRSAVTDQPELEKRESFWFYAGGGGCLTGWSGICRDTCLENIREDQIEHQAGIETCALQRTEIKRFGCFPGWSKCRCYCCSTVFGC